MRRRIAVPLLLALGAAVPAGCSSPTPTDASGRIRVVAAENFWGDIARQIGGSRVQVTSLLSDPSADPHLYESNARDAAAVASARIVVVNGVGYDDFMHDLLASTTGRRTVITVADLAPKLPSDANPHIWYDVERVRAAAVAIEQALARADPSHAKEFVRNDTMLDLQLQLVSAVLATIGREFPHAPVAYTERVPGDMLRSAGLDVVSPPGFARSIEDGNEPSAADTQRMKELIAHHEIRVLLYNSQATSAVTRAAQRDARAAGIPVVPVSELMPPSAASYQAWQLAQLRALLQALERGGR